MVEEKVTNRFEMIEVPTEFGLAFKDNLDESVMDQNQLLLKIANDIETIKKSVA